MAPETAGPGASQEWRSVEAAPKPQGLSAGPLLGESGVPREPATSPQPRDLCACTHVRAHTCTASHRPPRSQISARTHPRTHSEDAQAATCTRVHLHSSADVRRLPARFPAPTLSHVEMVGLHFCLLCPELLPRGRSGWTRCPWLLDKPEIVSVFFQILSTSLPPPPFPHSPLHCVAFLCILLPSEPTLSRPLLVLLARARYLLPTPRPPSPCLCLPLPQRCWEPERAPKNRSLATAAPRAAATRPPGTFSSAERRGSRRPRRAGCTRPSLTAS